MSLSMVKVGKSLHRMRVLQKPEVVRMPQIMGVRDLTKLFTLSNFVRVLVRGEEVGVMKGLFSKELAHVILDCMDASLEQMALYAERLDAKQIASVSDRKARTERIVSRINECAQAAVRIAPRDVNMILSFLKAEEKNPQGIRLPLQDELEAAFVSPELPIWPNVSLGEYIFEFVNGEYRSLVSQSLYLGLEKVQVVKQPQAQTIKDKADFRLVLGGDVETTENPFVGFRLAVPWSNLVSL